MAIHDLKIDAPHLIALMSGKKKAEIRKNDRFYQVGDTLNFFEYDVKSTITHITDFPEGLRDEYVCLSVTVPQAY